MISASGITSLCISTDLYARDCINMVNMSNIVCMYLLQTCIDFSACECNIQNSVHVCVCTNIKTFNLTIELCGT